MNANKRPAGKPSAGLMLYVGIALVLCFIPIYVIGFSDLFAVRYERADAATTTLKDKLLAPAKPKLDTVAYDKKMLALANQSTTTASTTQKWPVKAAYPKAGAILPFKRIVAYYGNFYSKGMGVLGEYPEDVMLAKLRAEVARWNAADPTTPALPAIDYIVETAQGSAGKDGMYRLRMPDTQIDHALALADKAGGIVILEFQVGLSSVARELPIYEEYLKKPNVHVALDPEFDMPGSAVPGSVIGTMSAADINGAAQYLAKLVQENDLPPKVLVVHRFTQKMVTGAALIRPLPEVQVIMDMDGWGSPAKKINTYRTFVASEPVQFTGFKLFYKNDLKAPSTRMLAPEEVLKLTPAPSFIQYQ